MHQTNASTYLATHCRVLRSFVSSLVSHQTMKTHQVVSHSIQWILWKMSMHPTALHLHQRSTNLQYASPTSHLKSCRCGYVHVFQWNTERFFSRHAQFHSGFHAMMVNKIYWDRPKIIFGFTIIPRWVVTWSWRRPVWFSSKIIWFFSSVWAVPDQGGCSQILIFSRNFDCFICNWNMEFSPFHWRQHFLCIVPSGVQFRCVHLLHFFNVCDHYVSLPDSSRGQHITKKFSWQDIWTELMQSR